MSFADWAAVASAVIAFVSMIGAGVGWFLAQREKNAAADHERRAVEAAEASAGHEKRAAQAATRSADASERAADAQEAIAAETATSAAANREAPWQYEHSRGQVWLLRNRLGQRAYGVELSHEYMKRGATAEKIDGYSSHEFMVINGAGEPVTVAWHWREDLSDTVPSWTGLLPR